MSFFHHDAHLITWNGEIHYPNKILKKLQHDKQIHVCTWKTEQYTIKVIAVIYCTISQHSLPFRESQNTFSANLSIHELELYLEARGAERRHGGEDYRLSKESQPGEPQSRVLNQTCIAISPWDKLYLALYLAPSVTSGWKPKPEKRQCDKNMNYKLVQ